MYKGLEEEEEEEEIKVNVITTHFLQIDPTSSIFIYENDWWANHV